MLKVNFTSTINVLTVMPVVQRRRSLLRAMTNTDILMCISNRQMIPSLNKQKLRLKHALLELLGLMGSDCLPLPLETSS